MTRYFQFIYGRRDGVLPPRVEIYWGEYHRYGLVDIGSDLCLVDYHLTYKHVQDFERVLVPLSKFTLQLGDGETKMCRISIYTSAIRLNAGRSHGSDVVCCSGHVFDRVMDQNLTIVQSKAHTCVFGFVQIYVLNASSRVKHLVKEQSVACFQASEPLRDATQDEREMQSR
jgi:hypothetical protein